MHKLVKLFYVYTGPQTALSLAILSVIFSGSALAQWQPLASQNRSPLKQLYLPPSLQFYGYTKKVSFSVQHALYSISQNDSTDNRSHNAQILLDGELQHSEITLGKTITDKVAVSVSLPWVSHSGGHADALIEGWHDWFGLPNGNRDQHPSNALHYRYSRDQSNQLELTNNTAGPGDIALALHYTKTHNNPQQITYQFDAGINAPTGSQHKLTGSGAWGYWLRLSAHQQNTIITKRLGWFASAGLVKHENTGVLENIRQSNIWLVQSGISWQWLNCCALKTQFEWQSAVYKEDLEGLGLPSLQLSSGISSHINSKTSLDVFFTEDVDVGSTPDFGMGIRLRINH